MTHRSLPLLAALAAAAFAQAPTVPVISARGVTNYFTQEPAPGIVGHGSLVQITGLNLGPAAGAVATGTPWPTKLADVQVAIGGKLAPLYSVSPGMILAQVPPDANVGLVNVVVQRDSGSSTPARVSVAALNPAVRTVKDAGFGQPAGSLNGQMLTIAADGLGATDPAIAAGDVAPAGTVAAPQATMAAYVGGLRAKVTATASSKRPGEFDVQIAMPPGARAGDLISVIANRQAANRTQLQPMQAPDVQLLALPANSPPIVTLLDTGVNGNFLLGLSARGQDGCYQAITAGTRPRGTALLSDCLTSVAAAVNPAIAPNQSDAIGALIGPPDGNAQSGISSTVKIFSAAGDPVTVKLPSPASVLTGSGTGFSALLPGTPPQVAIIDPVTGEMDVSPAPAPVGGGAAGPAVEVDGLKHVYASAGIGQGRLAVVVGDDALKPTKAAFAVINADGEVTLSKAFPAGWLPLLNAVAPARAGQPAPAPPREPAFFEQGQRQFVALARAVDGLHDAFVAFPLGNAEPDVQLFPDGWFAASCTPDIRIFTLELAGRIALAGSRVAEPEFKANCPGSGYLSMELASGAITAIPLPDQGSLRVPTVRNDASLSEMNNYVFGARLDTTRATTSDTLYVLDGVSGSSFVLPLPTTVNGFADASIQLIPELNSLLAQTIDRTAGDQGLLLFNLDTQTVTNLPVPEGFTTVASLNDGGSVCCLTTRKLVARALKQGASSVVIYDLITNDLTVVPNPNNVTSVGPPPGGAGGAAAGALFSSNSRANTVSAVAYNAQRQIGFLIIRVP